MRGNSSGDVYGSDVVIDASGAVHVRRKDLSKKVTGTSHIVSRQEAEHLLDQGADRLIIGTGQYGALRLSEEATAYLEETGCTVSLAPTPEAIERYNAADAAVARTISTGYGRHNVDFRDGSLTEIHCHGIGCYHGFPRAITIVDIGGQDNKIIRLREGGQRVEFKMNRKCAAGTGAFLEEMALRLDIDPQLLQC